MDKVDSLGASAYRAHLPFNSHGGLLAPLMAPYRVGFF